MEIKDSGQRTEFSTGAVRDIQEGKGRCDLMPLDVVAYIMENVDFPTGNDPYVPEVFRHIDAFKNHGNEYDLLNALVAFVNAEDSYPRWTTMLLEVAIHFEEGAKKYGENNWQKGIPVRRYVDSAVRHYLKWLRRDDDEPHARAFCWNIMCAIWTCKHKPELNDYLAQEEYDESDYNHCV